MNNPGKTEAKKNWLPRLPKQSRNAKKILATNNVHATDRWRLSGLAAS